MKGLKLAVTLFSFGIFLLAPQIPNTVLAGTVGTTAGVVVLFVTTLAALRFDMVLGLAVFLAAGALFLENRKRILAKLNATKQAVAATIPKDLLNSVENVATPAAPLVEGEVHPPHETPFTEEHGFEPSSETGSNAFNAVGPSINMKTALASGTPVSADVSAQGFLKAGLA